MKRAGVLQGTLDLMILQTLAALGPQHGYAIAARLEQVSDGALQLEHGHALSRAGPPRGARLDFGKWAQTESNRRARFYELTATRPQAAREGARRMAAHGGHHGQGAGVATCAS